MNLAEFLDLIPATAFPYMLEKFNNRRANKGHKRVVALGKTKEKFIARLPDIDDASVQDILNCFPPAVLKKAVSSVEPKFRTGVSKLAESILNPVQVYNNGGFCPLCQLQNDTDAEFCTLCGNTFPPNSDCPICKTANPIEARYCKKCGESRY